MLGMYIDRDKEAIEGINYAKNLYDMQVFKVKTEQHIEKLLLEDYIRTIKSYITRYDALNIFQDAQNQMNNKLKKDRPQFEMVKSIVMSDFLNNDKNFKITTIRSLGMESYAWSIEFEGYGTTFTIEIPNKKKITTENYEYARYGMFSFVVQTSKHSWETIKSSYRIEDITEAIKEYFNL